MTGRDIRGILGVMRVTSLRWSVGMFCVVLGGMMLVAPNEFTHPGYVLVRPALAWWGAALLVAGATLIGLPIVTTSRRARTAAFLLAAIPSTVIALSQSLVGNGTLAVWYWVVAFGILLCALMPERSEGRSWWDRPDLFSLLMGLCAIIGGGIMLWTGLVQGEVGNGMLPRHWYGPLFLLSGAVLILVQFSRVLRHSIAWAAHLIVAALSLLFVILGGADGRLLAHVFVGVFGTALAVLPWLGPRWMQFDRTSLRTRLALALAIAAALPLIIAVALVSDYQERLLIEDALTRQQRTAAMVAETVHGYVVLHRAAVEYLAELPGVIDLPPTVQAGLLERMVRVYPDLRALATFDASGQPIARSDAALAPPVTGFPIYERVRQTNGPSFDILVSPVYGRPVFAFGAPVRDAAGQFNGIVVGALDSTRLASVLDEQGNPDGVIGYLVDDRGQVLAHPQPSVAEPFQDLSQSSAVAVFLNSDSSAGAFTDDREGGAWLVGYARVPEFGWGVIVEQPLSVSLQSTHAGRVLAFETLLVSIAVAALGGSIIASWLTRPLVSLAQAAEKLADGDEAAPLPVPSTSELALLSAAFREMRDRLAARTAERAAAQEALLLLNASLEQRIAERTAQHEAAIRNLRSEMAERRRAEAEREELLDRLQFEQTRLEAVLRQMPSGVIIVEAGSNEVVLANSRAEELFERPLLHGMVIGKRQLGRPILPNGDELPTERLPLYRAVTNGEIISGEELCLRRQNGEIVTLEVSAAPIRDFDGEIIAGVLTLTDITERRRARDAERFLSKASSILAGSLDYEVTLSRLPQLAIPHLADWCAVHIVEDEQWMRRVSLVHVDPSRLDRDGAAITRFPLESEISVGAAWVLRTGQSHFVPEVTAEFLEQIAPSPVVRETFERLGLYSYMSVPLVARGRIIGAFTFGSASPTRRFTRADLAVAEELGRRAALAVDNALLYRAAQRAVKTRDEFLSVAAHELKTPVTSLRGFAQLAARQIAQGQQIDLQRIARAMHVIDQQSDKLARLVSQLLDVARIEGGRLNLEVRETDLARLLRDLVAAAQAGTTKHQIVLDAPASAIAMIDPLRVEQVVTNLIDNAVKYSPDGGPIAVALASEVRAGELWLRIEVTDRGIGIPPEHRPYIFDRFYQAHTDSHVSGMGLGLYISHEIVDLHGGELSAEFPEEGGSRFIVALPVGIDAQAASTAPSATSTTA